MGLRRLDYLTSQQGSKNISQLLTEVSKLDDPEVENDDELVKLVLGIIKDKLCIEDTEEAVLLTMIFMQLFQSKLIASNLIQPTFDISRSICEDTYDLVKVLSGLMYAAATINNSMLDDPKQGKAALTKRDYIRLSVLMYDLNMISLRNARTMREGATEKVH